MIADTKPQNIIVVAMIIFGIASGIGIATTANFYGGSYVIVKYLDVGLEEVRVGNLNPDNLTINPAIQMDFSIVAPEASAGEAYVTFLTASVYLNGDKLSYATFRRSIPSEHRTVTPGYDQTFTITSSIREPIDKYTLYNASADGEWVWGITLTIFYDVFDSPGDQVRVLAFSYEGYEEP